MKSANLIGCRFLNGATSQEVKQAQEAFEWADQEDREVFGPFRKMKEVCGLERTDKRTPGAIGIPELGRSDVFVGRGLWVPRIDRKSASLTRGPNVGLVICDDAWTLGSLEGVPGALAIRIFEVDPEAAAETAFDAVSTIGDLAAIVLDLSNVKDLLTFLAGKTRLAEYRTALRRINIPVAICFSGGTIPLGGTPWCPKDLRPIFSELLRDMKGFDAALPNWPGERRDDMVPEVVAGLSLAGTRKIGIRKAQLYFPVIDARRVLTENLVHRYRAWAKRLRGTILRVGRQPDLDLVRAYLDPLPEKITRIDFT